MRLRPLTEEEASALEDGLKLFEKLSAASRPFGVKAVKDVYSEFLVGDVEFKAGEIAIGLAFGQIMVDNHNYEWVRVSDEYGEETVVAIKGLKLFCSPVSMVQKRLERSEEVDFQELLDGTVLILEKKAQEVDFR